MKRYLNPVFISCAIGLALGNEFVLSYLFSRDGEFSSRANLWIRATDAVLIVVAMLSPWISPRVSALTVAAFRRSPNLAATVAGLGVVYVLAVVTELGFHAYNVIYDRTHPEPQLIRSVPSARLLEPGVVCREQRIDGDQEIYDFVYSLDDKGSRMTPASPVYATGRDLVFFGCSFTFGTGVNDDETLPNGVARRVPGWRVTNYGFGGYGPSHMLRRIEDPATTEFFRGNKTHVIYTYIPHHVQRAIGAMQYSSRFGTNAPYYKIGKNGEPEYLGTMTTGRPWLQPFYDIMDHEAVLKCFNVDLPMRIADRHIEYTASIIAASRDRWAQALPDSEFTVVIYPEPLWADTPAARIVPMLEARGIRCLNYADRFDGQTEMWIPGDYHPTAAAQDRVAQWIVEDLRLDPMGTTTD